MVGFMPLYAKRHSYGEYVFDHGWADAFERAGGAYYPKLQSSIPFSPVVSSKLLVAKGQNEPDVQKGLLQALKQLTDNMNISSAHLTFLPEIEAQIAAQQGYLLRQDQQFHWHNRDYKSFDDFLESLSSRKRKQVRKERQTAYSNGITIKRLKGTEISEEHIEAFYKFYLDTGNRKWGQPYLNKAFFYEITATMPDNILLIMCMREESYIAGALNIIGADTLYGRYWGCIENHPCLHFETCYYQAIEFAIENNLKTIEAGAQGEHKLARGYEPVHTISAHWISNQSFRTAVENYLEHETRSVEAEINYLSAHTPFKKQ